MTAYCEHCGQSTTDDDDWLTTDQVRERLKCGRTYLNQLRDKEILNPIRRGHRTLLWPESEVIAYKKSLEARAELRQRGISKEPEGVGR